MEVIYFNVGWFDAIMFYGLHFVLLCVCVLVLYYSFVFIGQNTIIHNNIMYFIYIFMYFIEYTYFIMFYIVFICIFGKRNTNN